MKISKLFEKTEEKEFTTFPATLETYAGINVAMWSFQPQSFLYWTSSI